MSLAKTTFRRVSLLLSLVPAACSSGSAGAGPGSDAGGPRGDAGRDAPALDAPALDAPASTTYPAFTPAVPQLVLGSPQGVVLATPQVRPVHFAGDTAAAHLDGVLSQWFASSMWATQTAEYGIGPATLATPVMLSEQPPATTSDPDIATWLQGKLDGTHPEFGGVDTATLQSEMFVIFYPPTSTVTYPGVGALCPDIGAYHLETVVGSAHVAYVVIQTCEGESQPTIDYREEYEVLATVGAPWPNSLPGYVSFDADHLAWNVLAGDDELSGGALCYFEEFGDGGTPLTSYAPVWSNAAMRAYHDPCVPTAATGSYFSSVPVMDDDVTTEFGTTKGIRVPVGGSVTVDVQLLSDGPTSGPWTVDASVLTATGKAQDAVSFAIDPATGKNGDTLHMTVTVKDAGVVPFVVTSTLGSRQTQWAGIVAQ